MRFYNSNHKFHCGVDLHAKSMYLCILDPSGAVVLHRNIRCVAEEFLRAIAPFREDIVVGAECTYSWYWLADLCRSEGIEFVLGHALYMKAIHGGKSKNDRIDSEKIARLLRGGTFPMAYVYPEQMRALRDLLRRRLFFVQKRSELMAHIQMTHHQYNLTAPAKSLVYKANREKLELRFQDESTNRMLESDLRMVEHYSAEIRKLEWFIPKTARNDAEIALILSLLKTIPGVGDILSLTLLYEIHDISRFATHQRFASYARLIKPEKTSAGKTTGGGGKKIGNHHLKWALSEATVLMLAKSETAQKYLKRLMKKGSKAKALSTMTHRLGKAVYYMLSRKEAFNPNFFFAH